MNNKQRMSEIHATQAAQGEKIKGIQEDCSTIKDCLLGNGKPGLVVRTDRLEQRDAFKSKLFWLVCTLVVGLSVTIAWGTIGEMVKAAGQ